MRRFYGLKGIIFGTLFIFGCSFALSPMDWHKPMLVTLYVMAILIGAMMVITGVITLNDKSKKKQGRK